MKRVVMRDVAEAAGVSITTVSHVVNGTRGVSDELRVRVLKVAQELGYRPNVLARGLRKGQSKTLGLIIPDSSNAFFGEVARGLERKSYSLGFSVMLCNTDGEPSREVVYIEMLMSKQVDGVALVSAGDNIKTVSVLRALKIPFVVVDRHVSGEEMDEVLVDNLQGGKLATEYLLSLGHTRIGCVSGPSILTPTVDRVRGYQQSLEAAGIEADETLIVKGDFQCGGGYRGTQFLLSLPEPPSAVFVCNDLMAIGAISAACAAGLQVPRDLSIVGFDDIALASFINPALTTVAQPKEDIGSVAADLLVQRILNRDIPPRKYVLPTELVVRGSCAQRR